MLILRGLRWMSRWWVATAFAEIPRNEPIWLGFEEPSVGPRNDVHLRITLS